MPTVGRWGDLGGDYCTHEDGVEIGVIAVIRKVLNTLHEIFVEEQDIDPHKYFNIWLRLPTNHEIKISDELGEITNFHEWIPKKTYTGYYLNILGNELVVKAPKKNFVSMLGFLMIPFDRYVLIENEFLRRVHDDESENLNAYGIISDTSDIILVMTLTFFIAKWLNLIGLTRMAMKMGAKLWKMFKTRKMRNQVDEIHESVLDTINPNVLTIAELDQKLDRLAGSIGLRFTL